MKYFLLRNEKTISDITDKVYKNLTAKRRKRVETMLLKENPELKKITAARKGLLVRIPKILDEGETERRNVLDPIDAVAERLAESLQALEKQLAGKFSAQEEQQKETAKKLKDAGKALKKHPNGTKAAQALRKHLKEARMANEKNKKMVRDALKQLQKTAAGFDRY